MHACIFPLTYHNHNTTTAAPPSHPPNPNPNATQDTGGIFADDWKTLEAEKMQILNELQPAPSRLEPAADGTGGLRYRGGVEPAGAKETAGVCSGAAAGGKKKGGDWFVGLFGKSKGK